MTSASAPKAPAARAPLPLGVKAWRNADFLLFAASGLFISTWASRVPGVTATLHLSTAVVGMILLGVSIGAIVGLAVAPQLQARLGSKTGLALVASVAGLGLLLAGMGGGLLDSLPLVVVGLVVLGFGNGAMDVMMNVSAAACERQVKRTVMPMMHACFSLGTVLGALIGAGAAALDISVFWHFAIMAVVTVSLAIGSTRFVSNAVTASDGAGHSTAHHRRSFRETLAAQLRVWADVRLVLIGVVMLGMAFAEGSANDWIALASVKGHGLDDAGGALVLDVFVAAMTIGRIAGGPAVDRIGRVWSVRITAILGIAGLLMFITLSAPYGYVIGVVLWGLGASLGFPLGMSAAADDERNATARVSAVAMIGYVAFLGGPPLIGFLGQHLGLLNALYVILALLVIAFFCAPALRRRTHTASALEPAA